MIKVKYGHMSDEALKKYLKYLIDRFFKIIPMKENNINTLHVYLESLQIELIGSKSLIDDLRNDPEFTSLLNTIQYFIDNETDFKTCKREVFKCISIIENLKTKFL